MRSFRIVFALPFIFFVHTSLAQTPLDLPEALRLAKANNLRIQQQQESQKIARMEELAAKAGLRPTLDFVAASEYLSKVNEIDLSETIGVAGRRIQLGGHERAELRLRVQQPLFTGFRLRSIADLARTARLNEAEKLALLENEIYHHVHLIFYRFQSLANQTNILNASLGRLRLQLTNARNLFEAAQAMAFDTLQVYNQILAVEIELQDAQLATRLARLQMAHLLNLRQARPLAEIDLARPEENPPDIAHLKADAYLNRPELSSVRFAQKSAALRQKLARSNYYPSAFLHANYQYSKPGLDPVANAWMGYFSVGVNLQWNLWRWQADRRRIEAQAIEFDRLTLREKEVLRAIEYEIEEGFEKLQFSLQQVTLAEQLESQENERYRILVVQHQAGVAPTNDLIKAEADLTSAALKTRQALIQYYVFLADLRKAAGTIHEEI